MTAHSVATFLGAVLVLATTDENMSDHLETIRAALEGGDDVENVEEVIMSFKNIHFLYCKSLQLYLKKKSYTFLETVEPNTRINHNRTAVSTVN